MSTHPDAPRIEQANDIAYKVIEVAQNLNPDQFVTLDFRYAIADALWAAGYRKPEAAPPVKAFDTSREPVKNGAVSLHVEAPPSDTDDPEEFCSRCYAGVDSSEHHEKCVVLGFAEDGESAPPSDTDNGQADHA